MSSTDSARLPDPLPGSVRCLLTPDSCQWTYSADLAQARAAAWRMHYADHQRGERSREARALIRSRSQLVPTHGGEPS